MKNKLVINSFSNPKIKKLAKLYDKKYIKKYGQFIIEDKDLLKEAANKNLLVEIYTYNYNKYNNFNNVIFVDEKIIKKFSKYKANQDFLAIINIKKYLSSDLSKFNKIIILDNIVDPGNMGNIIRNSNAFKFDAIVLVNNCVDPYNDKVIKASKGAILNIPIFISEINKLKDFYCFFFLLDNEAIPINNVKKINNKYALVYGNETRGISENVLKFLTGLKIYIPINNINSLNVASASAIGNYYFYNLNNI